MIHYSCDRCQRSLGEDDLRYVVRLEAYAAIESLDQQSPPDDDHLLELDQILEHLDDAENQALGADIYDRQRFDLCSDCYRVFSLSPFEGAAQRPLRLSDN